MLEALAWGVSGLVGLLLLSFVLYLVGLGSLPTEERPRTRTYDRFGRLIAVTENPDYHENPGEESARDPDV